MDALMMAQNISLEEEVRAYHELQEEKIQKKRKARSNVPVVEIPIVTTKNRFQVLEETVEHTMDFDTSQTPVSNDEDFLALSLKPAQRKEITEGPSRTKKIKTKVLPNGNAHDH